jgi:hypothetical protein
MFTEEQRQRIAAAARTSQIIVAALVIGVLIFLGVVLAMPRKADQHEPLITYMAAAFTLALIILSSIGPYLVASKALRFRGFVPASEGSVGLTHGLDDQTLVQLLGVFQSSVIVACAPLEGGAFFNLIAYFLEGRVISLIAVGILLILMAMRFPTTATAEDWIARVVRTWQ